MEGNCAVCFQQAELYHVTGYNILSCGVCSQRLAAKTSQDSSVVVQEPSDAAPIGDAKAVRKVAMRSQKVQMVPTAEIEQAIHKIENATFGSPGSCPYCGKSFGRKSSLINHIKNHAAEKKFNCNYCQKGFTQAANLRNHERIHRNERPYVCKDCGKAFTQITNLNNHRRLHTGERPFVCIENDCGRSFAQVTNLNNHMKSHHKVQQYACNQCPLLFTQVSQLNVHLSTHTGLSLFTCPHCPDRAFQHQGQLQQHLKEHGANFPFACGQCEEKFLSRIHLEKHRKMHDEFRYKCTMCSSSFNQEVLLKKHIQRHIDGRYLTCPVDGCEEGFTVKNQLTRHMEAHHSIGNCTQRISVKRLKMSNYVRSAVSGKYNCYFESCDGSFSDVDTLNSHLRGVHGLSIVKNAGKRSKMDLMLQEQMKQQRNEQSTAEFTATVEEGGRQEFVNYDQGTGEGASTSRGGGKSQEIQVQPDVAHLLVEQQY